MSTDLVAWIERRLASSDVSDEATLVVLSALEGAAALDNLLASGLAAPMSSPDQSGDGATAGGTFLTSLTVSGFRGVGPVVRLELAPRPGLTVIAGRNGSGKSSLSEAIELVLTGDTYRWQRKSAVEWRQQWRNLHHPHARIELGLVEEGTGPITVVTSWDDSATVVDDRTTTYQRPGAKKSDDLADLGWKRPLELFRPILSYDELGGILEGGPSELYDAFAALLGTEQLAAALKLVQSRHKALKAPADELSRQRKELKKKADELADERAPATAQELKKTSPDTARLQALVTGTESVPQGPVRQLRELLNLPTPGTLEAATHAADAIRDRAAALERTVDEGSARTASRLDVLAMALDVHAEHGDMQCPVCSGTRLDELWRADAVRHLQEGRRDLEALDVARQDLALAVAAGLRLVSGPPAALGSPIPEILEPLLALRQTWAAWADAPRGNGVSEARDLAEHLTSKLVPLHESLQDMLPAARDALNALDDVWQPFAVQVASWCLAWEEHRSQSEHLSALAEAEDWLKQHDLTLKNERLAPIVDGARHAWSRLKQESNVELGALELTGSGTRRRVLIDASVDGLAAGGISVLSQGELHALALALFLPRATMATSPFRFLVLDDPVQAMDPAKVDGLVDLLNELAATHQVIVLSHDDRLPAALRRSDRGATILEVARGAQSQISVSVATNPAERYVSDAHALVSEWEHEGVEEQALRRVLPGLLRFALEAAARDRYYSVSLAAGRPLEEVEKVWTSSTTTRNRLVLAVFGDPRPNHELDNWASPPYRKFSLGIASSGMHAGLKPGVEPRAAVRDVERVLKDLSAR